MEGRIELGSWGHLSRRCMSGGPRTGKRIICGTWFLLFRYYAWLSLKISHVSGWNHSDRVRKRERSDHLDEAESRNLARVSGGHA